MLRIFITHTLLTYLLLNLIIYHIQPIGAHNHYRHCRAQLKNANGHNAVKTKNYGKVRYFAFEKNWMPGYLGTNPESIETEVVWVSIGG